MSSFQPHAEALKPLVWCIWSDRPARAADDAGGIIERMLPQGVAHIAIRLDGVSIRVGRDRAPTSSVSLGSSLENSLGSAVLGGPRQSPYFKHLPVRGPSVGVQLAPGALPSLTGIDATEFAEQHIRLDDIWPRHLVQSLCDTLVSARGTNGHRAAIEAFLLERLREGSDVDFTPIIRANLSPVGIGGRSRSVAELVLASGLSHRHFNRRFRQAIGLGPKSFLRVRRLNAVLEYIARNPQATGAAVAATFGFADQAHLNRDFAALTGLAPSDYRRRNPPAIYHVPDGLDPP
ncbi:MAG: helix-turn-helix domain-containing protein [Pseudomonadota bacterium]